MSSGPRRSAALHAVSIAALLLVACGDDAVAATDSGPVPTDSGSSSTDSGQPDAGVAADAAREDARVAPSCDPGATLEVTRLNGGMPIITEAMFTALGGTATDGENISFPSVIRIPDWIPAADRADPSAMYYMYFTHHRAEFIRLAWATNPVGPWHLYGVGTGVAVGSRGVLDLGAGLAMTLANGIVIDGFIGSPGVHVDDVGHRIVMYFHGQVTVDGVRPVTLETFASTSANGLAFAAAVEPVMLGRAFFRVFAHGGQLYALANRGDPYRALDPAAPWAPPAAFAFANELWTRRADYPWGAVEWRHVGVRVRGDVLDVFFTRIGDAPERILYMAIDLAGGDFTAWAPTSPVCVLTPELPWEGSDIPPAPSLGGPAPEDVAQLRDPYLFEDVDGSLYLYYAGRGENAIGVASVRFL